MSGSYKLIIIKRYLSFNKLKKLNMRTRQRAHITGSMLVNSLVTFNCRDYNNANVIPVLAGVRSNLNPTTVSEYKLLHHFLITPAQQTRQPFALPYGLLKRPYSGLQWRVWQLTLGGTTLVKCSVPPIHSTTGRRTLLISSHPPTLLPYKRFVCAETMAMWQTQVGLQWTNKGPIRRVETEIEESIDISTQTLGRRGWRYGEGEWYT